MVYTCYNTFNSQTRILPKSIACGFPSVDHILILAISCCALWLHSRRWQSINFLSQPKIAQSPGRSGHKCVQNSKHTCTFLQYLSSWKKQHKERGKTYLCGNVHSVIWRLFAAGVPGGNLVIGELIWPQLLDVVDHQQCFPLVCFFTFIV